MPSVQETASEAITKLIYTYAERIDAGDFAGVAEVFAHATLTFEGFGDAVAGRDAIEALYGRTTRRYEDGTPKTKHVMTNVMVDVADDGEIGVEPLLLHGAASRAGRTGAAAGDRRPLPAHLHIARGPLGGRHHAHHDRPGRGPRPPHALRPDAMKLTLDYTWDCEPEAFWALYYDPAFTVRLHLDALGSTSAEVVSQEGDLTSGLVRTLRYGQRPNMPGPVRKIFGEEVVTHRGQHLRPRHDDDDLHHDARHHGQQDPD